MAVSVLRQICQGTSPDDAKSQEYLLLYMALSSSRHPDFIGEWRRRLHQMAAQDPHFLGHWRWMLHERRLFKALLKMLVPAIAQTLPQLRWTIVRLPEDGPEMLAISDRPIDICWAGPVGIPNPHTLVTMPICRHALLVGGQEPENVEKLFRHPRQVNAVQLSRCHEFIYSGYELDFDELKRMADQVTPAQQVFRVRRTLWTPRPSDP